MTAVVKHYGNCFHRSMASQCMNISQVLYAETDIMRIFKQGDKSVFHILAFISTVGIAIATEMYFCYSLQSDNEATANEH